MRKASQWIFFISAFFYTVFLQADSSNIDKVYHPYVLPFEREFEWRVTANEDDGGNTLSQRLAYGHSISEFVTLEAYIVAERDEENKFRFQAYELEARWMITPQGKYWADWGALFEYEKQHDRDISELIVGILFEKEIGKTSVTTNLLTSYEGGNDVQDGFETEFRLKYRYRWKPQLQPAVEVYSVGDFIGIGPAFMGIHRYQGQKQLKWELGFIVGFNDSNEDYTIRLALEYEF